MNEHELAKRTDQVRRYNALALMPFNVFMRAHMERYRVGESTGTAPDGTPIYRVDVAKAARDFLQTPEGRFSAENILVTNFMLAACLMGQDVAFINPF